MVISVGNSFLDVVSCIWNSRYCFANRYRHVPFCSPPDKHVVVENSVAKIEKLSRRRVNDLLFFSLQVIHFRLEDSPRAYTRN